VQDQAEGFTVVRAVAPTQVRVVDFILVPEAVCILVLAVVCTRGLAAAFTPGRGAVSTPDPAAVFTPGRGADFTPDPAADCIPDLLPTAAMFRLGTFLFVILRCAGCSIMRTDYAFTCTNGPGKSVQSSIFSPPVRPSSVHGQNSARAKLVFLRRWRSLWPALSASATGFLHY
jgi:hypothetical protein